MQLFIARNLFPLIYTMFQNPFLNKIFQVEPINWMLYLGWAKTGRAANFPKKKTI
jgi:hypothetical protein